MLSQSSTIPKVRSILFDLDGTIIDSRESIIEALNWVLEKNGISSVHELTGELIGPPLIDTIKKITGLDDDIVLDELMAGFKSRYDFSGYKSGKPFHKIKNVIEQLNDSGYDLYVVTNKRLIPTKKIIKYFSLSAYFKDLYSLDLIPNSPFRSKEEMIRRLLDEHNVERKHAIYVGDRLEDYHAARNNGINCLLVGWGYGVGANELIGHELVNTPDDLMTSIKNVN